MRWSSLAAVLPLLAVSLLLPPTVGSADDKRISVYSTIATYSLPVVDRQGREYVGLLEILEPLGSVSSRADREKWKLRYKKVDGEFTLDRSQARIGGRDVDLGGAFILESGRGFVPLSSLPAILPKFLGGPVTLRIASRRLFVGNVTTQFTVNLVATTPPRLIFNFTAPVNPMVSTEPGHLRLTFRRDPVVSGSAQEWKFDDRTISSVIFSENNGAAEITVNSTASLMANFSAAGRTITVSSPAPISAPEAPSSALRPSVAPPPAAPGSGGSATVTGTPPRQFLVVIDASHGGAERGAALTNDLAEKDVTLTFARAIRKELETRGVSVLMVRDSDALITVDQRSFITNARHTSLYLNVHAATQGTGVRVYSATLPPSSGNRGAWVDWETAQGGVLSSSRSLAAGATSELQKHHFTARSLPAPLRPLSSVLAPAITIELAPPSSNIADINLSSYQQPIAAAMADFVLSQKAQLESGR